MTEQKWLTCTGPEAMLAFLENRASHRKMRLFICGYCRTSLGLFLSDPVCEQAIAVGERDADGLATEADLRAAGQALLDVEKINDDEFTWSPYWAIDYIDYSGAVTEAWEAICHEACHYGGVGQRDQECLAAPLLRDLIGNPFHPLPPLNSSALMLNGGVVGQLAKAAYKERHLPSGLLDTARLAVLADALEENGCTHTDLLVHLRSGGRHVRGCWALDHVLDLE